MRERCGGAHREADARRPRGRAPPVRPREVKRRDTSTVRIGLRPSIAPHRPFASSAACAPRARPRSPNPIRARSRCPQGSARVARKRLKCAQRSRETRSIRASSAIRLGMVVDPQVEIWASPRLVWITSPARLLAAACRRPRPSPGAHGRDQPAPGRADRRARDRRARSPPAPAGPPACCRRRRRGRPKSPRTSRRRAAPVCAATRPCRIHHLCLPVVAAGILLDQGGERVPARSCRPAQRARDLFRAVERIDQRLRRHRADAGRGRRERARPPRRSGSPPAMPMAPLLRVLRDDRPGSSAPPQ